MVPDEEEIEVSRKLQSPGNLVKKLNIRHDTV